MTDAQFKNKCITEIIRSICLGQSFPVRIFSAVLTEPEFRELLRSLRVTQLPPIYKPVVSAPIPLYIYYTISIFLNEQLPVDFRLYYISELRKINQRWSDRLCNILVVPSAQFSTRDLCRGMISLLKVNRPLFHALQFEFLSILTRIPDKELINELQLEIFNMFDYIDMGLLSMFDFQQLISQSNISTFLQSPVLIVNKDVSKLVHLVLGLSSLYPAKSRLFDNTSLLTLTNSCILKRVYFVDVAATSCLDRLSDVKRTCTQLEDFAEMIPYVYLFNLDMIGKTSLPDLARLPNDPYNIFRRMYGDECLISFLKSSVNMIASLDDLKVHSIVYYTQSILRSISNKALQDLGQMQYLILRDEEKEADFNFMLTCKAIESLIEGQASQVDEIIQAITVKDCFVDIFSSLFLKDATGMYVCCLDTADQVIRALMTKWKDGIDYLSAATTRIMIARHISPEGKLENCFLDSVGMVTSCLAMGNYVHALEASELLKIMETECQIAHAIHMIREKDKCPVITDKEIQNRLLIEYAMSTEEYIEDVLRDCTLPDFVGKVLEKKRTILADKGELCEVIDNMNEFFEGKSPSPCVEKGFTGSFARFLDVFRRVPIPEGHTFRDIVNAMINRSDIPSWESLVQVFGDDPLEKLLSSCDVRYASSRLIELIKDVSPIIALVIEIYAGFEDNIVPAGPVMQRWKNREQCSNPASDADSLEDGPYTEIRDRLFKSDYDVSSVWELRCRYWDEAKEDVKFYQAALDFRTFLLVFPEYYSESLSDIDSETADPAKVLNELLDQRRFKEAYAVAEAFGIEYHDRMVKLIEQDLDNGKNVAPCFVGLESIAMRILKDLPPRYNEVKNHLMLFHFKQSYDSHMAETFEGCCKLLAFVPSLNLDKELMEIALKELSGDMGKIRDIAIRFIERLKNPLTLVDVLCKEVFRMVEEIRVDSFSEEQSAQAIIFSALQASRTIKNCLVRQFSYGFPYEIQALKIAFLYRFTSYHLYSRYQASYSFADFQGVSCATDLAVICARYDILDLLSQLQSIWSVSVSSLKIQSLYDMLQLGLFEQAKASLDEVLSSDSGKIVLGRLKVLLSCPPLYELHFNEDYSSGFLRLTDDTVSVIPKVRQEKMATDQEKLLRQVIAFYPTREQIQWHATRQEFSEAIDLWSQLPLRSQSLGLIVQLLVIPCISCGQLLSLFKCFEDVNKFKERLNVPVGYLLTYMTEHSLKLSCIAIETYFSLREELILTLVKFLNLNESWQSEMGDLQWIVNLVQTETASRSRSRANPCATQKLTDADLADIIQAVGLQVMFVQLCIDNGIPFSQELNLVTSQESIEAIAATALLHKKFYLGLQTAALKPQCLPVVCNILLENLDRRYLKDYFLEMQERIDAANYETLCTELMKTIVRRIRSPTDISVLINKVVHNIAIRIRIFVALGYLSNALSWAEKYDVRKEIPNIEQAARLAQDNDIVERCRRLLSRK